MVKISTDAPVTFKSFISFFHDPVIIIHLLQNQLNVFVKYAVKLTIKKKEK